MGSHVVSALLKQGNQVVVFDHRLHGKALSDATLRQVHPIEGDIRNAEAVRQAAVGCQAIFHFASMVGVELYSSLPASTMEVEEVGLRNVCAAANGGAHVIYASSSAVYGHAGGPVGLSESQVVTPVSNYGTAKRFNELYLMSQHAEHKLRSLSLRIFNVYGPGQDERLVTPRFVRRALRGEDIEIYGDGSQTRDFVYIDDVVAAALAYSRCTTGCEIVNVCSGQEITVRTLAEEIIRISRSSSKIIQRPPPAQRAAFEVSRSFGERNKLQNLLGVVSPTSLSDGLERTIDSFARN